MVSLSQDFQHEAHTGATHIFPAHSKVQGVHGDQRDGRDTRTKNTRWTAAKGGRRWRMQEPKEVSAKNDTKHPKGRVQELKTKSNKERKYS